MKINLFLTLIFNKQFKGCIFMNEHFKNRKNHKSNYGSNVFDQYYKNIKVSKGETVYRGKNDKTFIGRKRNLLNENLHLRKDKEKLLNENDNLFDENKQLKDEKDNLLDENKQLENDINKANEKLRKKKEKNKTLEEENKNLRKENNYMLNLLSRCSFLFNADNKQIDNNTENQQILNPYPWMVPVIGVDYLTSNSLFNNINKAIAKQKQNTVPKTSFSPLQK